MNQEPDNLKQIPDFPDYAVSRDGRVWSKPRKDTRGNKCGGQWLKPETISGYFRVVLSRNGITYKKLVHRLVLLGFVGPCPKEMQCRHLDGVRTNNRPSNLCWGTRLENAKDRVGHRTHPHGERNGHARLTESIVILIRQLWSIRWMGVTRQELGEMFGITADHVGVIIRRRIWKHI